MFCLFSVTIFLFHSVRLRRVFRETDLIKANVKSQSTTKQTVRLRRVFRETDLIKANVKSQSTTKHSIYSDMTAIGLFISYLD